MRTIILAALVSAVVLIALGLALPAGAGASAPIAPDAMTGAGAGGVD